MTDQGSGQSASTPYGSTPVWAPHATVFVSSFCIMVIELVAGRVISRHLGSSLYTWTSVIGVVLAGIAVGNYIGGVLADRFRPHKTLATLFVLSSVTCVGITLINHQVGGWVFLWTIPWALRVGTHVAIVFLVPSVFLGTISPVAAKIAIDRSTRTGRAIGSVYAWGVIGSLVGTFATGFWLIAAFGTAAVLWTVAAVLAGMGLIYGASSVRARTWAGVLVVLSVLGTGPWSWAKGIGERLSLREVIAQDVLWVQESQYTHIEVQQITKEPDRRNLLLGKLVHSTIVMEKPFDLQYGYVRIYGAVTSAHAAGRSRFNTLQIGGGGYIFPRWLQHTFPGSRTEVVEIDPEVTRAALEAFGLPADHEFVIAHEDGRAYVKQLVDRRRRDDDFALYDFIYNDVFDDYSVPYQLTTVEYFRDLHGLLAPDGLFLMNMIDIYEVGQLIGAMIATMEEVFEQVTVLSEGIPAAEQPGTRNTFILIGSKRRFDFSPVTSGYDQRVGLSALTPTQMETLQRKAGNRMLTDDWAPVENLLAPVVLRASRETAASQLVSRARALLRAGKPERADRMAERATRTSPELASAHDMRARTLVASGNKDAAVHELRVFTELRPSNADAWYRLGVLLADRKRLPEAVRAYERAIALRPMHLESHNDFGIALVGVGRLSDGIAQFEQILRVDANHVKARRNLEIARRQADR